LPIGNLINRLVGVVLVLPLLGVITAAFRQFQPDMARMTAEFHIAFNVTLALLFMPLLDLLARLLTKLLPARPRANDPSLPRYLEEGALDTPSLALVDAAR